jgi:hypothetical protein
VVEVIDAVQSWLEADSIGSVTLTVGGRSYTMFAPTALGAPTGQAA